MSSEEEVLAFLGRQLTPDPNPYTALQRVLALHPKQRRSLLRLEVWCEQSRCTPIRVFAVRDGLLVQCRSDANTEHMRDEHPQVQPWSRRRAFFLSEWLGMAEDVRAVSHLQVVCDCAQTTPRLVDVARLAELAQAGTTRRACRLPDVAAEDR